MTAFCQGKRVSGKNLRCFGGELAEAADFLMEFSFKDEQFVDKLSGLTEVLGMLDKLCRRSHTGVLILEEGDQVKVCTVFGELEKAEGAV